jgi:hypothetical protein
MALAISTRDRSETMWNGLSLTKRKGKQIAFLRDSVEPHVGFLSDSVSDKKIFSTRRISR